MVCSDFAIRVNVRRARGLTSSSVQLATTSLCVNSYEIHTIQQPKELRVEDCRAEEPQEQEPRDAAVAYTAQEVTIPILSTSSDMPEDNTQLDRTSWLCRDDRLPYLLGDCQQPLPVCIELLRR